MADPIYEKDLSPKGTLESTDWLRVVTDLDESVRVPATLVAPQNHVHTEAQITDLDKYSQAEVNGLISGFFTDAPADTKQYARQDNAWAEVVSGGSGGIYVSPVSPDAAGINAAFTVSSLVYLPIGIYDISDGDVICPPGSILRFEAGARVIGTGTLTGQYSRIEAGREQIFDVALNVQGDWDIDVAYPEWFGADNTGYTNDSGPAINKTIDTFHRVDMWKDGIYGIGTSIKACEWFEGNGCMLRNIATNNTTPLFEFTVLPFRVQNVVVSLLHYEKMAGGAFANGYTGNVFNILPEFRHITQTDELVVGVYYTIQSNTTGDFRRSSGVGIQGSGLLTIGSYYEITQAGGTFTSVGATDNNVGTFFTATGDTPTWGAGGVTARNDGLAGTGFFYNGTPPTWGDGILSSRDFQQDFRRKQSLVSNVAIYVDRTLGEQNPAFYNYSFTGFNIKPSNSTIAENNMYWCRFHNCSTYKADFSVRINMADYPPYASKPQSTIWSNCTFDSQRTAIQIGPDADGHQFSNLTIQPMNSASGWGTQNQTNTLDIASSYNTIRGIIWDVHYAETVWLRDTATRNVIEYNGNFKSASEQDPHDFARVDGGNGNLNYIGHNPLARIAANGDVDWLYGSLNIPEVNVDELTIVNKVTFPMGVPMPVSTLSNTTGVGMYELNGTNQYLQSGNIATPAEPFHREMFGMIKVRVDSRNAFNNLLVYGGASNGRAGLDIRTEDDGRLYYKVNGAINSSGKVDSQVFINKGETVVIGVGAQLYGGGAGNYRISSYVNGLYKDSTVTPTVDLGSTFSTTQAYGLSVGTSVNRDVNWLEGGVEWVMFGNYYPTDEEIRLFSNDPLSIPFKNKGGSNTRQISGTLVIGKEYIVTIGRKPEITTITTVADVTSSLNDTYFEIHSALDTTDYYVWYNVNGVGIDPALASKTGIEVALVEDDTADIVASKTQTAINAIVDFTATVSTNIVTVTNVADGGSTDAADTGSTGFTISVTQQGLTGGDFSNVGGPATATVDDVFVATGTTPTSWGDAQLVKRGMIIHCVGNKELSTWNNLYGSGNLVVNAGATISDTVVSRAGSMSYDNTTNIGSPKTVQGAIDYLAANSGPVPITNNVFAMGSGSSIQDSPLTYDGTSVVKYAANVTSPTIQVHNTGGAGGAQLQFTDDNSSSDWKFKSIGTGGFKIRDEVDALDVMTVENNSKANAIYIKAGGNIGIGTNLPAQALDVVGNVKMNAPIVNVTDVNTTTYTVQADDYILSVGTDVTAAPVAITIPSAEKYKGRSLVVKDAGGSGGTHTVTITATGSLIDGAVSIGLSTNFQSINLYSDGLDWFIF